MKKYWLPLMLAALLVGGCRWSTKVEMEVESDNPLGKSLNRKSQEGEEKKAEVSGLQPGANPGVRPEQNSPPPGTEKPDPKKTELPEARSPALPKASPVQARPTQKDQPAAGQNSEEREQPEPKAAPEPPPEPKVKPQETLYDGFDNTPPGREPGMEADVMYRRELFLALEEACSDIDGVMIVSERLDIVDQVSGRAAEIGTMPGSRLEQMRKDICGNPPPDAILTDQLRREVHMAMYMSGLYQRALDEIVPPRR